jgi:hypothetical protein
MLNKKALAGTPSTPPVFVEDVFSTYLFTGTETARSITNDIDLSTKGGLVWIKGRNAGYDNNIIDTVTGSGLRLRTNSAVLQVAAATGVTSFNSNGFSLGTSPEMNGNTVPYASWTFREQAKFFDVVTYTGDGSAPRAISHNLGSAPGMVIIRKTSATGDWLVYHRSSPSGGNLYLNYTDAADAGTNPFLSAVSSTTFTLSTNQNATTNANGATYVAYLFAHDAGGFGTAGTDNVISCGSFTATSGDDVVTLGFEPQFLMVKKTNSTGNWSIFDSMRGFNLTETTELKPNTSGAEESGFGTSYWVPTATGFIQKGNWGAGTYIYMAIRRPMKVPTTGTSVFSPIARTGTGSATSVSVGFPLDLLIFADRTAAQSAAKFFVNRLTGTTKLLNSTNTNAEVDDSDAFTLFGNTTYTIGADSNLRSNNNGTTYINWAFRRAPGFFDEVCYTGTGSNLTLSHNLGAVPELMIVKIRGVNTGFWAVYSATLGSTKVLRLNGTQAEATTAGYWTSTPTASVFYVGTNNEVNITADTYVAYLFASCPGVSKVGSYTGTGTTQTINCGFTGGARFVLIKRTDSTGDWYVWDTARGIISGNDPYLLLNSGDAEVTNTDYIDPVSSGFELSSTAPAAINASGGSFIFFAVA